MDWLVSLVSQLIKDKFCGDITIRFYHGGITQVEKKETFKPPV